MRHKVNIFVSFNRVKHNWQWNFFIIQNILLVSATIKAIKTQKTKITILAQFNIFNKMIKDNLFPTPFAISVANFAI